MKEVQQIEKDNIQIVKQVQVKKQTKLQRRIIPGDGHQVFEFNIETNELRKAQFVVESNVDLNKKGRVSKKVSMKDGCIYVTSLNAKNAIRKLMKELHVQFVKVISE